MKTIKFALINILVVFFICSCSSTGKVTSEESWKTYETVRYGTEKLQYVDITLPKNGKKINAVLFIHGFGVKMHYPTYIDTFRSDYAVGIMNYRNIMENVNLTELLYDVQNVIDKIRTTAANDGYSIGKIIIIGQSMGGSLALLYSYDYLKQGSPIPIAFCVNISGITDFGDPTFINWAGQQGYLFNKAQWASVLSIGIGKQVTVDDFTNFGYSENVKKITKEHSPINFITENTPPTIIVHDTNDKTIPFSNAVSLNLALTFKNVPHEFITTTNSLDHTMGAKYTDISTKEMRRSITDYNPELKSKLLETINKYIDLYCK